MGLEISEAMYAGCSYIGDTKLKEASKDTELFNELYPDVINSFRNNAEDAGGTIAEMLSKINLMNESESSQKDLYSDLAAGISAVLGTRKNLGVGVPDKVFMTGNSWPDEVAPFRISAFGMDDYNSSDVILRYGNVYYGISLKKKAFFNANPPTLINNAFSSFFKGTEFTKLNMEMMQAKTKFFAKVIFDACSDNSPSSPFYVKEANDGKGGTILECNQTYQTKATKKLKTESYSIKGMRLQSDGTLNISDAKKILDIKVDIWKYSKLKGWYVKSGVKLLQLKDPQYLTRISSDFPVEFQNKFRDYVNKSLYAKGGKISQLWETFVAIMNDDRPRSGGKSIKQAMVDSLFTRILKLNLYTELDKIKRNDFKFYLVTGVGRALKGRGSDNFSPKVEPATIKSLSSILANLAELCPDDCRKTIEFQEASDTEASVSLVLFVTPKGSQNKVPILNIKLRYAGNFSAYPRFEATMTKEFLAYGKKKST
tara:strand:- start:782 stop:2233 length:1452 start_codon:yes stop_codon:yes gene_type:complete